MGETCGCVRPGPDAGLLLPHSPAAGAGRPRGGHTKLKPVQPSMMFLQREKKRGAGVSQSRGEAGGSSERHAYPGGASLARQHPPAAADGCHQADERHDYVEGVEACRRWGCGEVASGLHSRFAAVGRMPAGLGPRSPRIFQGDSSKAALSMSEGKRIWRGRAAEEAWWRGAGQETSRHAAQRAPRRPGIKQHLGASPARLQRPVRDGADEARDGAEEGPAARAGRGGGGGEGERRGCARGRVRCSPRRRLPPCTPARQPGPHQAQTRQTRAS